MDRHHPPVNKPLQIARHSVQSPRQFILTAMAIALSRSRSRFHLIHSQGNNPRAVQFGLRLES